MIQSDRRYYERRASAEMLAAERALTPEARARRLDLAATFTRRLAELRG